MGFISLAWLFGFKEVLKDRRKVQFLIMQNWVMTYRCQLNDFDPCLGKWKITSPTLERSLNLAGFQQIEISTCVDVRLVSRMHVCEKEIKWEVYPVQSPLECQRNNAIDSHRFFSVSCDCALLMLRSHMVKPAVPCWQARRRSWES